jgi:hypothetical protein
VTSRPAPRKSGRAPKSDRGAQLIGVLEPATLQALEAAVYLQNQRHVPDVGPKSRYLSEGACDLELAIIEGQPKHVIERLCIDIAATALRIREQGDGR